MDLKVLLLHLAKALLEASLTPSNPCVIRPRATKPLQVGCYILFSAYILWKAWSSIFSSIRKAHSRSVRGHPHMFLTEVLPTLFWNSQYNSLSISPLQEREHHQISLIRRNYQPRHSLSSLKIKSWRILTPKASSSWSKVYRTQRSSSFSRPHG